MIEDDEPINDEVPEQEENLPGPAEEKRDAMAAQDAEVMQQLTPESPANEPSLVDDAQVLEQLSGSMQEPKQTLQEEVQQVTSEPSLGQAPEAPDPTAAYEADAEVFDSMAKGTVSEDFGNAVDAFNGGGDDFSDGGPDFGEPGDSDNGGPRQLMDSMFEHENQQDEMLIDAARRLDEMTRALEMERL